MTVSNEYDNYWKLDTYGNVKKHELFKRLKELGYARVRGTDLKPELVTLLQRHDRGLICYDKLSQGELYSIAEKRGLYSRDRRSKQDQLAHELPRLLLPKLEKMDDERDFPRFMELPAELRTRVYELYVAAFPHTLRLPTKPPLSRTSRLVRQEVLPVLYENAEFQIDIKQHSHAPRQFLESNETQLFLLHLAAADAACIRRLRLVVNRCVSSNVSRTMDDVQMVFCVDLDSRDESTRVRQIPGGPYRSQWWSKQSQQSLLKGIMRFVDNLEKTSGRTAFKLSDIHALRDVVEDARNYSSG